MSKIISPDKRAAKKAWLKRNFIPVLILLLVVAITIGLFLFRDRVAEFKDYGYLGAFLISLTLNATIILPVGNFLILAALGAVLPSAIAVGLAGGAGAAIGEITGYMAGYSGRGVVEKSRLYLRLAGWLRRWGVIAIFVFSLVPFFFDLVGIAAGALRFPLWKFVLVCWLSRTILYIGIALAGARGWEAALPYFG